MKQWLTVEEKKELVQKVKESAKGENISIKEACKRLEVPYWKYFGALKTMKREDKKAGIEAGRLVASSTNGELKVKLAFKGDAARLVRGYAGAYGVEPEAICKILLIDALKEKKTAASNEGE